MPGMLYISNVPSRVSTRTLRSPSVYFKGAYMCQTSPEIVFDWLKLGSGHREYFSVHDE